MSSSRIFKLAGKIAVISTSTSLLFYPPSANAAEAENIPESPLWDYNWDKRSPGIMLEHYNRRLKRKTQDNEKSKEDFATKASRNIFLIRHGQYCTKGLDDEDRKLTEIGRLQAHETGKRLKDLNFPYTNFVSSTMQRAKETAEIIEQYVPLKICEYDDNLREGMPYPPEPPIALYRFEHRVNNRYRIEIAELHFLYLLFSTMKTERESRQRLGNISKEETQEK